MGMHGLVQSHPLAVGKERRKLVTQSTERLVNRASTAASGALILMLVATGGYILWPRVSSYFGVTVSAATPAYATGQKVDVPAAWYEGSEHTLIVFARASCSACEKAQPFLKDLVTKLDGLATAVMGHPAGAPEDDQKFANSVGITTEHVFETVPGLRVKATPTLVLVDRQGRVLSAWEGVGKADHQTDILTAFQSSLR
jgi:peroxiredoxin